MDQDPISLTTDIPKVSDFTAYLPDLPAFADQLKNLSKLASKEAKLAYDCEAMIQTRKADGSVTQMIGPQHTRRIHACKCFKGSHWSLTIRQKEEEGIIEIPDPPAEIRSSKFAAKPSAGEEFLNSFKEICDSLYDSIFEEKKIGTTGLVVVTGGTGCGKSQVIRGLINRFICDRHNLNTWFKRKRLPHLVTYEDPIEVTLFGSENPESSADASWIDYTPRQRDIDVPGLRHAINSALRQTPAAFYVGEVRDIDEWKLLLEFAGTGHLIFTTSHAGSLVEAMGKLFAATSSDTAARRAIVADRLAALVHLRLDQLVTSPNLTSTTPAPSDSGSPLSSADQPNASLLQPITPVGPEPPFIRNILVPALWRHTMVGAKTLMGEGQSSLLPHVGGGFADQSCFGRTYFCDKLSGFAKTRSVPPRFFKDFRRRCTDWDLEGL